MKTDEKSIPDPARGVPSVPVSAITDIDVDVWVRLIRAEDAPLLGELLRSLSPQSIYFRFFSFIRHFPDHLLRRLADVDESREIALVALIGSDRLVGVARVIILKNGKHAEFAVLVGDPWQGKGIGAELLKRCLRIAHARGVETVWGRVLPENTRMLALGRKLGFVSKRVPDANEYELIIDLRKQGTPP